MIKGFEEQTAPLTEYEKNTLLPVMVNCLRCKIGKAMRVTNAFIVSRMRACNYDISDARVRKIINHIRIHDLVPCLIASPKGYYIADCEEDLKDYEETLKGRISAQQEVLKAIHRQGMQKFALL